MSQSLCLKAILLAALCLCASPVFSQQTTGSISGRVIADDGQPLRKVTVIVLASGSNPMKSMFGLKRYLTDEDGRFQVDGLVPAAYRIVANAPGYVMSEDASDLEATVHRIGDTPTIRLHKGGVITGKVTDASGKPLVGIAVDAVPIDREQSFNGDQVLSVLERDVRNSRTTDDRGQYRLYGLKQGKYIVVANPTALMQREPSPFTALQPSYHPSATRDAATVINVMSGSENGGVDIRFQGGAGFAVSGTLQGLSGGQGLISSATTVQLKQAGTENLIATAMVVPLGGNNAFAFYGIPNGEYEIFARQVMLEDQSQSGSMPQKVVVKNADLTGLKLAVSPMSSVAGKLVLDPAPQCKEARQSELDEITLRIERAPAQNKNASLRAMLGETAQSFPDEHGAFKFTGLVAGNYWLQPNLPDAHWYLKSQSAATPGAVLPANGLALKAGAKLNNLTVTLAPNGAQLQGRVSTRNAAQVFLIPAEPEAQNHVLRFAETTTASDGAFAFTNLAPGKYLLLSRPVPKSDEPARQPAAWDAAERAKLIKEAVAANQVVELKACQVVKGYEVKVQ